MTNPYAPPQAMVQDLADPHATNVPADRGTRLAAAIIDGLIFGALVYLPLGMGVVMGAAAGTATDSDEAVGAGVIIGVLGACIGFIIWMSLTILFMRRNSQSIAKKILNIKVVRADGSPVSLSRLIWLRNVVNWLISVVPLYGLVDVLFIFGESRQCLHDKLADTIVVKA